RRARLAVGALERVARAACPPVAGLVPPRRGERHPPPRRVLATAALLRRLSVSPGSKKPAAAGFFLRSASGRASREHRSPQGGGANERKGKTKEETHRKPGTTGDRIAGTGAGQALRGAQG